MIIVTKLDKMENKQELNWTKVSFNACHNLRNNSTQNVQQGMTLKGQMNIRVPARVAVLYLSGYRQSSAGCFCLCSSAVETSSVSGHQMTQLYWKAF